MCAQDVTLIGNQQWLDLGECLAERLGALKEDLLRSWPLPGILGVGEYDHVSIDPTAMFDFGGVQCSRQFNLSVSSFRCVLQRIRQRSRRVKAEPDGQGQNGRESGKRPVDFCAEGKCIFFI